MTSISGTILAVCSCSVLPLFGSIYKRGAGLGPAVAFLYSGPAINVLAIALTARVLGWQLGVARAVGAITFSVVIGMLMHLICLKEENSELNQEQEESMDEEEQIVRPLWQVSFYFISMVGLLVFVNWGKPLEPVGLWHILFKLKWGITSLLALSLSVCLWLFFKVSLFRITLAALPAVVLGILFPQYPAIAFIVGSIGLTGLTFFGGDELEQWRGHTWRFAKQIAPLLFVGVLAAGFFLGGPAGGDVGFIPNIWIQALVGDSPSALLELLNAGGDNIPSWLGFIWPIWTNFFASLAGALMYFATLTEVPILRGLIDSGMGQGPALALLLSGPALSLPSMLVINSILGSKKTMIFIGLVVVMATISGVGYGWIVK
ncbi:MAG: hypothetical protein GX811_09150, partial [Lentisphaerae bacterium]|nr:hypothetical protein [Lentisphaerota bacterium]